MGGLERRGTSERGDHHIGMALDLEHLRSRLGRTTGGLSGPAIKPLALARCHEVVRAVRIPVIGSGGIMNGLDALEFLAIGAAAVQVGTVSFLRPAAAGLVLEEMREFLAARGIRRLSDWRGILASDEALGTHGCALPEMTVPEPAKSGQ